MDWFTTFFRHPVSDDLRRTLADRVKAEARAFQLTPLSATERDRLDTWYWSRTGQETLTALFWRIWRQMIDLSEWAMPAHDARHAIFKVPATTLEYIYALRLSSHERVGLFGALLHDYGRWAEERIYGEPGQSALHARLSFVLARQLLDEFDLPPGIRSQILHAVVQHTGGATAQDSLPLQLTVTADRDQLYGPEIVLRIAHHPVDAKGNLASFYGERPGQSILDRVTHYLANRLPGPVLCREAEVDNLYRILQTFILMAEEPSASASRFSNPRLNLAGRDWQARWEAAQALLPNTSISAREALNSLLRAPHVSPNKVFLEQALERVRTVPARLEPRLAAALSWLQAQRMAADERQALALETMAKKAEDTVTAVCSRALLAHWHASTPGETSEA